MYASTLLVEMAQKFLTALGGAHMRLCVCLCVRACVFSSWFEETIYFMAVFVSVDLIF